MKLRWMRRALKDMKRLDRDVRERIVEGTKRFAEIEYGDIRQVEGAEDYALRIGDWRIFFDPPENDTIWITAVRPRDKAYKRK